MSNAVEARFWAKVQKRGEDMRQDQVQANCTQLKSVKQSSEFYADELE